MSTAKRMGTTLLLLSLSSSIALAAQENGSGTDDGGWALTLDRSFFFPRTEELERPGAELSIPVTADEQPTVAGDAAIGIQGPASTLSPWVFISPFLAVEGHAATEKDEAENAWRFRSGAVLNLGDPRPTPRIPSIYATMAGKFEADRDFDTKKVMGEALLTLPDTLGIGRRIPQDGRFVSFVYVPAVGLEAGSTLERGQSTERGAILRLLGSVNVSMRLEFLPRDLRDHLSLFAEEQGLLHPLESEAHNFFVTGAEYVVTEYHRAEIGVQLAYQLGETSPLFDHTESFELGVSIKFASGEAAD